MGVALTGLVHVAAVDQLHSRLALCGVALLVLVAAIEKGGHLDGPRSKLRSPFHGLRRTAPRAMRSERSVAVATKLLKLLRMPKWCSRSGVQVDTSSEKFLVLFIFVRRN